MDEKGLERFEKVSFDGDEISELERFLLQRGITPNETKDGRRVTFAQNNGYTDVLVEAINEESAKYPIVILRQYIEERYNPDKQVIINRRSGEFRIH